MARPSKYSEAVTVSICERIADGQSLREICRDEAMPSKSTVLLWLSQHTEFSDHYARARELQADHLFDEILEISDDATNDWMERKQGEDTVTVVDHEYIARSKLRVDSRKWMAGKLAPKKYGDKLGLAGPDGGPVRIAIDKDDAGLL